MDGKQRLPPAGHRCTYVRMQLSNSSMHAPPRVRSAVQRHQSPERSILHQISSLMYPKIQQRQVVMNVLHSSCVQPPRWSPPVLWRRFEDGLANICVLVHSCMIPKESETTGLNDGWKWWLVGNATDVGISDKVVSTNVQDSSTTHAHYYAHMHTQTDNPKT